MTHDSINLARRRRLIRELASSKRLSFCAFAATLDRNVLETVDDQFVPNPCGQSGANVTIVAVSIIMGWLGEQPETRLVRPLLPLAMQEPGGQAHVTEAVGRRGGLAHHVTGT